MCDPVSATAAAAGGAQMGQAVLGYFGQREDAANAKKYNKRLMLQTKQAYLDDVTAIETRLDQSQKAAAMELSQVAIARKKAQASARVSAAEAGVSGISVDALMADYLRTEATHKDAVLQNLEWEKAQAGFEKKAAAAKATNTYTQGFNYAKKPGIGQLLIGGAQAGASAGSMFIK